MNFINLTRRSLHISRTIQQKLYVGNLSWNADEETLRELFGKHGEVIDSFIIRDKLTGSLQLIIGKSRGFGFVEFPTLEQANTAIEALNGTPNEGRSLRVNLAEEK